MKLNTYFTSRNKINWKWIKDLSVRAKTIKVLEDNIRGKLHSIKFGNIFLDMTPKPQQPNLPAHWDLHSVTQNQTYGEVQYGSMPRVSSL